MNNSQFLLLRSSRSKEGVSSQMPHSKAFWMWALAMTHPASFEPPALPECHTEIPKISVATLRGTSLPTLGTGCSLQSGQQKAGGVTTEVVATEGL